jgi:hypothetical protein
LLQIKFLFNQATPRPWVAQTDSLSQADVYAGLQATIAVLAALNQRQHTGRGQFIDIAMAATIISINERAHVDLKGLDLNDEPAILGATDGSYFSGPGGENWSPQSAWSAALLSGSLSRRCDALTWRLIRASVRQLPGGPISRC